MHSLVESYVSYGFKSWCDYLLVVKLDMPLNVCKSRRPRASVKVDGHVHGKVLRNECMESHAYHQSHIISGKYSYSNFQTYN